MIKRITYSIIIPGFASLVCIVVLYNAILNSDFISKKIKIELTLDASQQGQLQLFLEDDNEFKASVVKTINIPSAVKDYRIEIDIPLVDKPGRIRIDPGFTRGEWIFKKISLRGYQNSVDFSGSQLIENFEATNDIKLFKIEGDGLRVISNGPDSNFTSLFSLTKYSNALDDKPLFYFLPLCFSVCVGFFVFYFLFKRQLAMSNIHFSSNHILVLCFLAILILPGIKMIFFPSDSNTGENRKLKQKPSFDFSVLTDYPNQYNAYFEDNFGFRKELSTLNSYYKLKLFNASSKPELVAVGKNSWLFSTDSKIVGDYQNLNLFSSSELNTIKYNLEEVYQYYENKGIPFFIMIMPIKSNIYPEYLPEIIQRKSSITKLEQLRRYLDKNSFVKIIDVSEELIANKSNAEVYYQHDVHMNFQGGFIAYKKLILEMQKKIPALALVPDKNYKKELKHLHNADLSRLLSLENILLNDEWHVQKKSDFDFTIVDAPTFESLSLVEPTIRTQIKNSTLPKGVVYRDSFFNLMMPYFSENVRDCIYLWTTDMSVEVVEEEKPDFVVYEILEAKMNKLLEDNPTGIRKVK